MRTIKLRKCVRIHHLYFSSCGRRLLVVGGKTPTRSDSGISVDVVAGTEIDRITFPRPTCYNVDPAIERFVIGGYDGFFGEGQPARWTRVPGEARWHDIPMGGVGRICDVGFDRTGQRLAVTSATDTANPSRPRCKVDVFQFPLGEPPKLLCSMRTKRPAGAIEFSYDGTRLALGAGLGGNDAFEVFDLATRKRLFQFDPKVKDRRAVRFLPDGRVAAAGGSKVYILPAEGGKPQLVLGGEGKALVNDVGVAANGRLVAAMDNGTVCFWDTNTGAAGPVFKWGVGGVWSVALAPDGLTCAAAGSKGRVVIWDVE